MRKNTIRLNADPIPTITVTTRLPATVYPRLVAKCLDKGTSINQFLIKLIEDELRRNPPLPDVNRRN